MCGPCAHLAIAISAVSTFSFLQPFFFRIDVFTRHEALQQLFRETGALLLRQLERFPLNLGQFSTHAWRF